MPGRRGLSKASFSRLTLVFARPGHWSNSFSEAWTISENDWNFKCQIGANKRIMENPYPEGGSQGRDICFVDTLERGEGRLKY